MKTTQLKLVSAAVGASAVIAMGAIGVTFSSVSSAEPDTSTNPTPTAVIGETSTTTTPPSTPETTQATPSIEGPAPLPPEEEGLPG